MWNAVKWMGRGRCSFELEKVRNRRSGFSQWRYAKMTLAAKAQDRPQYHIIHITTPHLVREWNFLVGDRFMRILSYATSETRNLS